jgi:hypothetical protein
MSEQVTPDRPTNSASKQSGRFRRGVSGNPAGRAAGSRNRASLVADALADGELEGIVKKVIADAKAGDAKAREIVLARAWPPRKGRRVQLDLPEVKSAADITSAMSAVTRAVAKGEITPDEGQAVAAILESQRKAIELADIERRVTALEARKEKP